MGGKIIPETLQHHVQKRKDSYQPRNLPHLTLVSVPHDTHKTKKKQKPVVNKKCQYIEKLSLFSLIIIIFIPLVAVAGNNADTSYVVYIHLLYHEPPPESFSLYLYDFAVYIQSMMLM